MAWRTIPNWLSGLRLAALPVLWGVALAGNAVWLGWLLLAAWTTDVLDGYLARRWGVESAWGSRLDTIGDHLLLFSMLAWVALLEGDFVRAEAVALTVWLGLWIGALVFGWVKFRRFADLHLYSSKVAVFLAVTFIIHLFIADGYSTAFFYAAVTAGVVSSLEMVAVMSRRQRVDEKIGSLLHDLQRS